MNDVKFKGIAITEEDRRFSKHFESVNSKFEIEIPLPYQKIAIIANTSRALGGMTVEAVGADAYEYARMCVTLAMVVTSAPEWWNGPDNCPDDNFLIELWRFYRSCEQEFTSRLKTKTTSKALEKS